MSQEQTSLESWWNEDPEMRYVEISCGDNLRVRVRLFQVMFDGPEKELADVEAGTLLEAIDRAVMVANGE